MERKTQENVYTAFVGEAKAHFRLRAYAEKARQEGEKQAALLFEAIAEAERVHATKHMNLLQDIVVKDTETNLMESLKRENSISENEYPDFLSQAENEGETAAATTFSQARDAEKKHAKLYEQAMYHVMRGEIEAYYVCQVCGYVNEKRPSRNAPYVECQRRNSRRSRNNYDLHPNMRSACCMGFEKQRNYLEY